jgi:hypothetical protein
MTDRANVVEGGPSVLRVLALFALGALTLLSFAPIGAGVLAGSVASAAGCTLDEGSVHPCLVLGHDVGDALYTGFVLTWLAFVTWPGMLVALGLWTWVLVRGLRKRAAPRGTVSRP